MDERTQGIVFGIIGVLLVIGFIVMVITIMWPVAVGALAGYTVYLLLTEKSDSTKSRKAP